MTKPIDNSFWVIPDLLLAGEHPGAAGEEEMVRRIRRFLVSGVSQFIDLSDKKECGSYEEILTRESGLLGVDARYSHHPIRDKGKPAAAFGSFGWSGEAVNIIEDHLRNLKLRVVKEGKRARFLPNNKEADMLVRFGEEFVQELEEKA